MHDYHAHSNPNAVSRQFIHRLRRSPGLRSVAYICTCAALPRVAPGPLPGKDPWSRAANRTYGSVVVFSTTWLFSRLGDDAYFRWKRSEVPVRLREGAIGLGLGASAFGAFTAVACALDWVSIPEWGWQTERASDVNTTLLSLGVYQLAVASSEELIFRGYALHTLGQAIGVPAATTLLNLMFARAHGNDPQVLLGQSALGLALTTLRLTGQSIWMPIGYHFAWNYAQTALLGPTDAPTSLLPMHNHGPEEWIGKPGHPEPGLLSTLLNLTVAAGIALLWWRHRKR